MSEDKETTEAADLAGRLEPLVGPLLRLFRRKEATGRTWDMRLHSSWGNHIQWFDWKTQRVTGHTSPIPKIGDVLLAEMKSGKIARFLFVEIEPCFDPPDMWFATVSYVGYEP